MKRNCLLFAFAFMLLLSTGAFAAMVGDVTIKLDGDSLFIGQDNILYFWLANDMPLYGLSIAFEFKHPAVNLTYVTPYGTKPGGTPYVMEHNRAIGMFDLGGLLPNVSLLVSADRILMGGAANTTPLPAGASDLLYSMKINVPPGEPETPNGFCVDNIFYPPAGTWTFAEVVNSYAPTFQGQPNPGGEVNPDAPDVCFDVMIMPCAPPVFTSTPTSPVSRNKCLAYTFDFNANDVDPTCQPGSGIFSETGRGTIDPSTGQFDVAAAGATSCVSEDFVVTYTNCCGSSANFPFTINWTNNDPTVTNCPVTEGKVAKGNPWIYDFNASDLDICEQLTWSVAQDQSCPSPDGVPVGGFSINSATGVFTFNTDDADGGKHFCFVATVTDGCGATDACCFCVEVLATEPFIIQIEKTHNTQQGHVEMVKITKFAGSELIGGFDFLIGYDASALMFIGADPGADIAPQPGGDGWEYFTYRYGAFGNCDGPCPSGYLRVIAIADQNNGPFHPTWTHQAPPPMELVILKFYVTNDRTFECQKVDIRFVWFDCGDNGLSNVGGDTLWISQEVYEYQWDGDLGNPAWKITGLDCGWNFHMGGACAECDTYDKAHPVRFIYFWNGAIDIVCADSVDKRGDLNLNGIENEIADAVLYTNYFIYGIGVFDIATQGQIAASDVNNDGHVLTVGDLVYLVRIITGDELPYPKLAPFANSATISVVNGLVSTEASSEIGGVYATFKVNGAYSVINRTDMELLSNEVNGELKVLVYSGLNNTTNRIQSGTNELFAVNGEVELVNVEVADYNGNMLSTRVEKNVLPTAFSLKQNVPNPFNPTTKIGLDLPSVSDWTLDVYNVAGQLVRNYSGHGQGSIQVEVDANGLASGLYFYRATAGSFTDTKKMVLMK